MKKGGGKAKGGEFERWVCKQLSLAISNDKRDDIFWRSAMSGGRATVKFKKGVKNVTQVGDISAIDPIGNKLTDKFVIECKRYKNIRWDSLIYGTPTGGNILEFWQKVQEEAIRVKKSPLLIIKENGRIPVICINYFTNIEHPVITSNYFKVFWFSNFLKNIKKFTEKRKIKINYE